MASCKHSLILFFFFLFSLGCVSEENSLKGSISSNSNYPLDFEKVEVLVYYDQGIQILYLLPLDDSDQENQTVNLFVDNNGIDLQAEVPVDLYSHGTITRFWYYQDSSGQLIKDSRSFPGILEGNFILHEFSLTPGKTISGEFSLIFVNGDTLLGSFSAPMEIGTLED